MLKNRGIEGPAPLLGAKKKASISSERPAKRNENTARPPRGVVEGVKVLGALVASALDLSRPRPFRKKPGGRGTSAAQVEEHASK